MSWHHWWHVECSWGWSKGEGCMPSRMPTSAQTADTCNSTKSTIIDYLNDFMHLMFQNIFMCVCMQQVLNIGIEFKPVKEAHLYLKVTGRCICFYNVINGVPIMNFRLFSTVFKYQQWCANHGFFTDSCLWFNYLIEAPRLHHFFQKLWVQLLAHGEVDIQVHVPSL